MATGGQAPPRVLPRFRGCGIGDEAGRSVERQVAAHVELGWPAIELRSVDGVPLAALPRSRRRELVAAVRQAELEVPVLDSTIGDWRSSIAGDPRLDEQELDALAQLARELGAWGVRIMSYPSDGRPDAEWRAAVLRRVRELARRAEQHGLVLLHENCHGWAASDPERARELVEAVDGPALRLLLDVGNPVAHGYDGLAYAESVADLVAHVHVKDALRHGPGPDDHEFVLPGSGDARVLDCLAALAAAGFSGTLSAEPHVALVYHRGGDCDDETLASSYVEYGRALERLLSAAAAPGGAAENTITTHRGTL